LLSENSQSAALGKAKFCTSYSQDRLEKLFPIFFDLEGVLFHPAQAAGKRPVSLSNLLD
jgi:hypothetical protein